METLSSHFRFRLPGWQGLRLRALHLPRQCLAASALCLALSPAQAVDTIAVPEAAIERLFSDAGVAIDLRVAPGRNLADASLLDLNRAEFFALRPTLGLAAADPTVALVFVDTLNTTDFSANQDAVAGVSQGVTAIEAAAMARLFAVHLSAQSLGYNLGLSTVSGSTGNLMNPTYLDIPNNPAALTAAQIQIVLRSPLLQTDANGQRFIDILPVYVTAATPAVPEPASWALMLAGAAALGLVRRRRPLR